MMEVKIILNDEADSVLITSEKTTDEVRLEFLDFADELHHTQLVDKAHMPEFVAGLLLASEYKEDAQPKDPTAVAIRKMAGGKAERVPDIANEYDHKYTPGGNVASYVLGGLYVFLDGSVLVIYGPYCAGYPNMDEAKKNHEAIEEL